MQPQKQVPVDFSLTVNTLLSEIPDLPLPEPPKGEHPYISLEITSGEKEGALYLAEQINSHTEQGLCEFLNMFDEPSEKAWLEAHYGEWWAQAMLWEHRPCDISLIIGFATIDLCESFVALLDQRG